MTDIKSLLEERHETFNNFTAEILNGLPELKEAALEMLGEEVSDRVEWKGVAMFEDMVIIEGAIEFKLGEQMSTPDGDIEITEEMIQLMAQTIRVIVPTEMAQTASVGEILTYLKEVKANDQAQEKNANVVNTATNQAIDTVHDLVGEFRSNGLSKEQITSMIAFAEHSKGKVN